MHDFMTLLVGLSQVSCVYDAGLPFEWDRLGSTPLTFSHSRELVCHPSLGKLQALIQGPQHGIDLATCYD